MMIQKKTSLKFLAFFTLIFFVHISEAHTSSSEEVDAGNIRIGLPPPLDFGEGLGRDLLEEEQSHNTAHRDRPCHHIPDEPYSLEGEIPEALETNRRFQYLQNWGYRYWVAERCLGAIRYVIGGAGLFCITASKWNFFSDETQNGLQIAAIPISFVYGTLEGTTQVVGARARGYRKEAKGYIDRANRRAGLPIEGDDPEVVIE